MNRSKAKLEENIKSTKNDNNDDVNVDYLYADNHNMT